MTTTIRTGVRYAARLAQATLLAFAILFPLGALLGNMGMFAFGILVLFGMFLVMLAGVVEYVGKRVVWDTK